MPFTRLVCCATVLVGLPVEGFRPSASESTVADQARDDVCCCKSSIGEYKPLSSTETHIVPMQDYHCKRFKQVRPDRPFWWWGSKCCWTSGYACTPTIGFLMMHNDGGDKVSDEAEKAKWCPVSSPQGAVGPVDPTMAYNQNIEYLNTKIMTTLIQNAAGFAAGSGGVPHSTGAFSKFASDLKTCDRAGEVALGNGFRGIQKDLGAGTSMLETLSRERQKIAWKYSDGIITSEYSDGQLTSEWMHIDVDESRERQVNNKTFLSVPLEQASCIELDQGESEAANPGQMLRLSMLLPKSAGGSLPSRPPRARLQAARPDTAGSELLEWLQGEGAEVSELLEVRQDPVLGRELVVREAVDEEEELVKVTPELCIPVEEEGDTSMTEDVRLALILLQEVAEAGQWEAYRSTWPSEDFLREVMPVFWQSSRFADYPTMPRLQAQVHA
ncbi:Smyd3, partial [Symbiodinium microadriaticum]